MLRYHPDDPRSSMSGYEGSLTPAQQVRMIGGHCPNISRGPFFYPMSSPVRCWPVFSVPRYGSQLVSGAIGCYDSFMCAGCQGPKISCSATPSVCLVTAAAYLFDEHGMDPPHFARRVTRPSTTTKRCGQSMMNCETYRGGKSSKCFP